MLIWLKAILFVCATAGILWVSRSSIEDARFHGFYRFFAWEAILILFLMNMDYWFINPFSPRQIISWLFLILSVVLIYLGVQAFRQKGKVVQDRGDERLLGIEKTTELVTAGIYGLIRHPFYCSLLFLGWGIFLKNISWMAVVLTAVITFLLVETARREEGENIQFFGENYRKYMENTKRFIPYIF